MTPAEYKIERGRRGSQEKVAAALGVNRVTIAKREAGTPGWPITREAWLALCSLPLPKTPKRPKKRTNDKDQATASTK